MFTATRICGSFAMLEPGKLILVSFVVTNRQELVTPVHVIRDPCLLGGLECQDTS